MCSNNPEPPAIIGEVNPLNEVAVDADSGNCTPDEQEFDMQAHYVQEPEADVTDNSVAAESTMEDERPNDIPSDEDFDSMSLEECLRFWALKTNQPHQSINMILDIIRKKNGWKPITTVCSIIIENYTECYNKHHGDWRWSILVLRDKKLSSRLLPVSLFLYIVT